MARRDDAAASRSPACSIDSPAHAAGLSPGDEIVAIDRFRATGDGELRNLLGAAVGDTVMISLFRRHGSLELPVALAAAPPTRYEIVRRRDPGPAAARYQAWLGEAHPGAQSLATITTTARWV